MSTVEFRKFGRGLALVPMLMCGAQSAFAQLSQQAPSGAVSQDQTDGGGASDIIVTATRREQSIQDVPLSITAFAAEQLESKGVTGFTDFAIAVPNLAFGLSGGDGGLGARGVVLRGIVGSGTTGFYIDETPIIDTLDPHIVDLARIEVLRGPQGTLYGARSMGGTIRLITERPDSSNTSGLIHASLSTVSNGDWNYLVESAVNVPLIQEKLAVRASGYYNSDSGVFDKGLGGPLTSPPNSIQKNVDDHQDYGGQIAMRMQLGENLTITPRVMVQRLRQDGSSSAQGSTANFLQRQVFNIPEVGSDDWNLYSLTAIFNADFGTFLSSTSYFDRKTNETEDASDAFEFFLGSPTRAPITRFIGLKRFVQEFRFTSDFEGPFQLIAGAFFSDSKRPRDYDWRGAGVTANFGFANDLVFRFIDERKTKELAFYGEASYELTPKLKATVGLRQFTNRASLTEFSDGLFYGQASSATSPVAKENGINPKFLVEYKATPNVLLYGSAAKGFRTGGNNISIPSQCDPDLVRLGLTRNQIGSFQSDSIWNYEVGAKSSFANRRIVMNATAFRIDWTNIQQRVSLPSCGFGFFGNAGAARSQGFEFELSARPTTQLNLGLNVGYTNAKIIRAGANTPQRAGDRVNETPELTLSFNAEYHTPVSDAFDFFARGDFSHIGDSLSDNNSPGAPRIRPAYETVDFRFGLRSERYDITVFAKNVTNERANLASAIQIGAEVPGRVRFGTNRPRTVGIEGRVRF